MGRQGSVSRWSLTVWCRGRERQSRTSELRQWWGQVMLKPSIKTPDRHLDKPLMAGWRTGWLAGWLAGWLINNIYRLINGIDRLIDSIIC